MENEANSIPDNVDELLVDGLLDPEDLNRLLIAAETDCHNTNDPTQPRAILD